MLVLSQDFVAVLFYCRTKKVQGASRQQQSLTLIRVGTGIPGMRMRRWRCLTR